MRQTVPAIAARRQCNRAPFRELGHCGCARTYAPGWSYGRRRFTVFFRPSAALHTRDAPIRPKAAYSACNCYVVGFASALEPAPADGPPANGMPAPRMRRRPLRVPCTVAHYCTLAAGQIRGAEASSGFTTLVPWHMRPILEIECTQRVSTSQATEQSLCPCDLGERPGNSGSRTRRQTARRIRFA